MSTVVAKDLGPHRIPNYRLRLRRHCVIAMYALTAIQGFALAMGIVHPSVYLIYSAIYASAYTSWAINDSRVRGRPMIRIAEELFFFGWPVATLVYSVGARRWKGLGLWLAHAIGLYITLLLAFNGRSLLIRWSA